MFLLDSTYIFKFMNFNSVEALYSSMLWGFMEYEYKKEMSNIKKFFLSKISSL